MDVMEAIKTRRSIRKYKSTPVEDEKIIECLEAARWAPSANNSQPWEFLVVKNPETRRKLADIHRYGRFMAESPVVVVFIADPERSSNWYHGDVAVSVQNFLLAAHSLGLGTCWMGVLNTPFEEPIKKLLGIPDGLRVLCTVSVGYPDEKPSRSRRPLEEVTHWEKYGLKSK
ncbi:MAG: nitroreductase family protein [Thermoproteota archaeon]